MKNYPSLAGSALEDVLTVLNFITRERDTDIREYNNLQNRFIAGRKVGKIPSSSLDVDPADRVGDVSYDTAYYYILVDNGGSAEWRRIALGVF